MWVNLRFHQIQVLFWNPCRDEPIPDRFVTRSLPALAKKHSLRVRVRYRKVDHLEASARGLGVVRTRKVKG